MKLFRTIVSPKPVKPSLTLKNRVFTIGSCFADAIGNRLKKFKFFSCVNPFGTVYNPVSIHTLLNQSLEAARVLEHTFVQRDGIYFNYNFHSQLSSSDKKKLESLIEDVIKNAHQSILEADIILITYGTSWVYQRNDTQEIVANCHKIPQQNFTKRLLSEDEIQTSFSAFYNNINSLNSNVRFVLTVSPVRHLKDTLELNSVSKAVLRKACHDLSQNFQNVEYFPAYEMMMDDLRDYRFYKSDMLHPTEEAEDYIWENFLETYLDKKGKSFIAEWNTILSAMNHKPFHPGSETHQKFLKDTLHRLENLASMVDVTEEAELIKQQLLTLQTSK